MLLDDIARAIYWAVAPHRSRRLTFTYDAEGVRIASDTLRKKRAEPTDALDVRPSDLSVRAELFSSVGVLLYRKRTLGAFPTSVEVIEADGSFHHDPVTGAERAFTVIVPLDPGASRLDLVAGSAMATPGHDPSDRSTAKDRVLRSFDLREGRFSGVQPR